VTGDRWPSDVKSRALISPSGAFRAKIVKERFRNQAGHMITCHWPLPPVL
jgi:hypothetical protein